MLNRIVFIFSIDEKEWCKKNFEDLRHGDIFKIMDGSSRYYNEDNGDNIWVAQGSPYKNKDGIWTINTLY